MLRDGHVVRRHVDALRKREVLYPTLQTPQTPEAGDSDDDFYLPDTPVTPRVAPAPAPVQPASVRRSARNRHPPDRLWL